LKPCAFKLRVNWIGERELGGGEEKGEVNKGMKFLYCISFLRCGN
jgi:hypothetical protein